MNHRLIINFYHDFIVYGQAQPLMNIHFCTVSDLSTGQMDPRVGSGRVGSRFCRISGKHYTKPEAKNVMTS